MDAKQQWRQLRKLCELAVNKEDDARIRNNPGPGIHLDDHGNWVVYMTWVDVSDGTGRVALCKRGATVEEAINNTFTFLTGKREGNEHVVIWPPDGFKEVTWDGKDWVISPYPAG